jgi:hypothetical protein
MHEDLAAMKSTVVRVSALSKARHVADSSKGRFARRANSGFVPLLKAFPAVWRLMHKEHFPEFAVSPADRLSWTILHQYALNWTKVREDGEFMDYLGWVFANWSALGAGVFGWMNDFPNTPSIRILTNAKLRTYIEEAYTEKERLARWRTMDEFERMVHHLVHKRGMDKEKAEELARKRTGFVDQMKELKKERELVAAMAQRSQQAIQQEREALSRQRRAPVTKRGPLKQGEGSFGKFEP